MRMAAIVCALFALRASNAVELEPLFTTAVIGDLIEWQIKDPDPAWMDFDVERLPVLIITGPDRRALRRSAFLHQLCKANPDVESEAEFIADGERVLRIRHTVRSAGQQRWELRDSKGAALAAGEFTAADAARPRAPIRVSADNPRLLAYTDGTPFIPIGPNIAWAKEPNRLPRFERYLRALHEAGGTHFRLWCSSWCGQVEGAAPDSYRLEHAWVLDRILAMARENHLLVTLVLDNHHDFFYGYSFPYGKDPGDRVDNFLSGQPPEQYQRRLRYLLARYGADDTIMAWELFNELDMACSDRDMCVAWMRGASSLLARFDQDQRLRTVSWAADDWDLMAEVPYLDITQVHGYVLEWTQSSDRVKEATRDGVGMLVNIAERANRLNRPFCFSEVGYQGAENANVGNDLDLDGLLLRQQMWGGFMLGGYGTGMSWWWDVYIDSRSMWGQYHGFSSAVQRIDWRDHGLTPLQPNERSLLRIIGWQSPTQALLWPHPRSDTWYAHLIEGKGRPVFNKAIPVTMNGLQPSSKFRVHQLDMITGEEKSVSEVASDDKGLLPIEIPEVCLDVVMHIELVK
jgi:hypothetical protein